MDDDEILAQAKIIQVKREKLRRQQVHDKIIESCHELPPLIDLPQRYAIIYCDPPWQHAAGKTNRSPANHYPTMPLKDIMAMPVGNIAAVNSLLFMWVVNSLLPEALKVIEHWGFKYVANMVWVKDKIGLGFYVRYQHEILLLARRGTMLLPEPKDRVSSVVYSPRTRHSQKPQDFYEIIEGMYGDDLPKLELFSRIPRPGWTSYGNQLSVQLPF